MKKYARIYLPKLKNLWNTSHQKILCGPKKGPMESSHMFSTFEHHQPKFTTITTQGNTEPGMSPECAWNEPGLRLV